MYKLLKLQNKFILVSDEKIKEGDWIYHNIYGISKLDKPYLPYHKNKKFICKKIISENIDFSLLNKTDCFAIGWVDVEKLANIFAVRSGCEYREDLVRISKGYQEGFKTAQFLNDKMFSLEQIKKAIVQGSLNWQDRKEQTIGGILTEIIQSLQQTSWNVEVEMECIYGDECPSKGAYLKQHLCKVQPKITNNSIKIIKILSN